MAGTKFLDNAGLQFFWSKIKSTFATQKSLTDAQTDLEAKINSKTTDAFSEIGLTFGDSDKPSSATLAAEGPSKFNLAQGQNVQIAVDDSTNTITISGPSPEEFAVPKADATTDGTMSKEDYVKLKNIQEKAEVNTIEGISFNGISLIPDEATRVVSINATTSEDLEEVKKEIEGDVDTKLDEVNTKLSSVYTFKNSVENYSDLPTENNKVGDVYNVTNANGNYPAGTNYAWTGSEWDALGGEFVIEAIPNSDIDAICNDVLAPEGE